MVQLEITDNHLSTMGKEKSNYLATVTSSFIDFNFDAVV